jgi:hypothetical protein
MLKTKKMKRKFFTSLVATVLATILGATSLVAQNAIPVINGERVIQAEGAFLLPYEWNVPKDQPKITYKLFIDRSLVSNCANVTLYGADENGQIWTNVLWTTGSKNPTAPGDYLVINQVNFDGVGFDVIYIDDPWVTIDTSTEKKNFQLSHNPLWLRRV